VKTARDPWLAAELSERVAALLQLTPEHWDELEHYGLTPRGRGNVLLFQASRATMARVLDRCRFLRHWVREGRMVLPPGDRVQVERAIAKLETLLDHQPTKELTP
jgi:hypothetical protein